MSRELQTNDMGYAPQPRAHGRRNKTTKMRVWGGNALLVSLFVQGLPLGRELTESVNQWADEKYALALENATTGGLTTSLVPAVIWGVVYLISIILILKYSKKSFIFVVKRQWPLTILLWLVPLSIIWSDYPYRIIINAIHTFGVAAICFVAAMSYKDDPAQFLRKVTMVMGANILVHLAAVLVMPEVAIAYDGRWRGLNTHSNTFGELALITFWASTSYLVIFDTRGKGRWITAIIIASLIALVGAKSVTSWLSSVFALGLLLFVKYSSSKRRAFDLVLFVLFVIGLFVFSFSDVILQVVAPEIGRSADLSGRFNHWADAIKLISNRPLFGYGFDNNATVIQIAHLPTMHFHNGVLDLMVRGGTIAIVVWTLVLFQLYKNVRKSRNEWLLVIVPFIMSVFLYNISEVTFLQNRNPMWILMLSMIFVSLLNKRTV